MLQFLLLVIIKCYDALSPQCIHSQSLDWSVGWVLMCEFHIYATNLHK